MMLLFVCGLLLCLVSAHYPGSASQNVMASTCLALLDDWRCHQEKIQGLRGEVGGASSQAVEARLQSDLLKDYWAYDGIRPVLNTSQTVVVRFGFALLQILDFDTDTGELHIRTWERFLWKDELLAWDPDEYEGVSVTRMKPHQIWQPDITLYNSMDVKKDTGDHLVLVTNDGSVMSIPPTTVKVTCNPGTHEGFDGDVWTCTLMFGSWTFDGFLVDLDFYNGMRDIDLSDMSPHREVDILETSADKNDKYYPCCDEPYPDLTFHLVLGKRSKSSSESDSSD